ncbi:MAG: HEAT repeat protein [Planctomycetota bacterium]|jgi:HEAT repeat protein
MNDTIKSIVGLLQEGKPELQVAAAQVLGELRPKESAAIDALSNGVDRSPLLGRFCLDALAKIANAAALAKMAEAVVEHEVLSDHAAHLLGEIGTEAHGVLADIYPQAIGEQRGRILTVLGRKLSDASIPVVVDALLTSDLMEAAATMLESGNAQMTTARKKLLRESLEERLDESVATTVPSNTVARLLGVLAVVDAEGSKALFLKYIEADSPSLIRSAAFRALRGTELTATQTKAMMASLEDATQKGVHDAIREVLVGLPELPTGLAPGLKRLLASRQPEQRLFAIRMLRSAGGAELAKSFVKLLDHDDERFREAAIEGLSNNKQAVEPLLKLMQSTKNLDMSQKAGAILARLASHITPKMQKAAGEKVVKLLATNSRLGDMLLDLVLLAGGTKITPFFIDKAIRMRRAQRTSEALHMLAKIGASDYSDDEVHYQIALIKLLASADEVEGAGTPGNSTMGFFSVLIRAGFPLFDRLKRESAIKPEMLLRVATYFTQAVGAERRFGTEMLQYLANRTKGRAGDEARLVLRTAGMV